MINKYQGRLWLNEQPKHQNPKVMQKDTEKSRKNILKKSLDQDTNENPI